MIDADLRERAARVVAAANAAGVTLGAAESCTGGLVSAAITEVPGSSAVFPGAVVSYANDVKAARLHVGGDILERFGAVSEETARAMLKGLFQAIPCTIGVAITGVAGPGGGTADKPVGMVCFAAGRADAPTHVVTQKFGDIGRSAVRLKSVETALTLLEHEIGPGGSQC